MFFDSSHLMTSRLGSSDLAMRDRTFMGGQFKIAKFRTFTDLSDIGFRIRICQYDTYFHFRSVKSVGTLL